MLIRPWANCGRAVALDSTVLREPVAECGTKRTERPVKCPTPPSTPRPIGQNRAGTGGSTVGSCTWQLPTVAGVWIPLAAQLTPANEADSQLAEKLLQELPSEARFVLGDTHYNAPEVRQLCESQECILVASGHRGAYPHTDPGVEVRRIFHELRSRAIENFNGQFKSIFDGQGQVPTKGLLNTARFALGAVLVYQLALLYQHEHDQDLRAGLKAFLKAA